MVYPTTEDLTIKLMEYHVVRNVLLFRERIPLYPKTNSAFTWAVEEARCTGNSNDSEIAATTESCEVSRGQQRNAGYRGDQCDQLQLHAPN